MNKFLSLNTFLIGLSILFLSSCTAYKKIPYLENAETLSKEQLMATAIKYEPKIMVNDILSISVNSQVPGVASEFNLPLLPDGSTKVNQEKFTKASSSSGTIQNYIVDKEGNIDFPVIGVIKVAGLTQSGLEKKIAKLISPKYLTQEPIVNVRFLNYKIAVLGEVEEPGVYTSANGVMTLFDALAMAGDLTIYGKRENVMLLRENDNGEISVFRINLQDKDLLLNKHLYYLQQNDKIIVEANKTRGNSAAIGTLETVGLSALSIVISVIAIVAK